MSDKFYKTITLETKMTFTQALDHLMQGKCIGIKPGNNSGFLVLYKPAWMNQESPDFFLCWNKRPTQEVETGIRTNQYLEEWYPVVIDHRELPEKISSHLF